MTQAEWMMLWLCAVAALLHGLSVWLSYDEYGCSVQRISA